MSKIIVDISYDPPSIGECAPKTLQVEITEGDLIALAEHKAYVQHGIGSMWITSTKLNISNEEK